MNPVKVEKLSLKQISRLLNGHGVRVKLGNHHVMNLHHEHAKKLHKAHLKGCGVTLTLDPHSIVNNQHLRGIVKGMGAVSEQLKHAAADNAVNLMTASTDRGIQGIQGNGAVSKQLKEAAAKSAADLMTASVERAIKGIKGNGMKKHKMHGGLITLPPPAVHPDTYVGTGKRKHRKHTMGMGAVGNQLKQAAADNAINLMTASTDRGIQGIQANGLKRKKRGGAMIPAGYGVSGVNKLKKYSSAIGDVVGLNSKAAREAKQQIVGALGKAGSTYIMSQVPGSQFAPPAPTKPTKPRGIPPSSPDDYAPGNSPSDYAPDIPIAYAEPVPTKAPKLTTGADFGLPPLPDDNYYVPTGKLYASGAKRIPKYLRPKRVLSEKQKAALALGRTKLKQKLIEMGAGRKHKKGGALYNAGYDQFTS